MIAGIFHQGSGLGDQLFRYITVRTLALDKECEFGMLNPENFKGKDFMKLDMGNKILQREDGLISHDGSNWFKPHIFNEKQITENGIDIRSYDPEINFVEDNTIIDGGFEDIKYWGHRLNEIREWLVTDDVFFRKVTDTYDSVCSINFRGGEFATVPELFLPKEYWEEAIKIMRKKYPQYPNMIFEVSTDDKVLAKNIFPSFAITQDIRLNWLSVRYAKHLILSNSAFGILPALLNKNVKEVIAPRYWARRNIKVWARPACYYKKFTYI